MKLQNKKIFVAGHNGLVGAALCRRLAATGCEILTADRQTLDLQQQGAVENWFAAHRPAMVILAAARVGGIAANKAAPADFIADNLAIQNNVITTAHRHDVEKLLFLGSSCIYPKDAPQPLAEKYLLTGPLEPTNDAYAVAKIAGVMLCRSYHRQYGRNYIAAMPCNLYGPGDRYDAQRAHVIPALIAKLDKAARQNRRHITLWGTGTPLREFLYVDDLADALIFMMENYHEETPLNIGSGQEISIAALAQKIAAIVGYKGEISFDPTHPDGVQRKLLDSSRLKNLGWRGPQTNLDHGLMQAYQDFRQRVKYAD